MGVLTIRARGSLKDATGGVDAIEEVQEVVGFVGQSMVPADTFDVRFVCTEVMLDAIPSGTPDPNTGLQMDAGAECSMVNNRLYCRYSTDVNGYPDRPDIVVKAHWLYMCGWGALFESVPIAITAGDLVLFPNQSTRLVGWTPTDRAGVYRFLLREAVSSTEWRLVFEKVGWDVYSSDSSLQVPHTYTPESTGPKFLDELSDTETRQSATYDVIHVPGGVATNWIENAPPVNQVWQVLLQIPHVPGYSVTTIGASHLGESVWEYDPTEYPHPTDPTLAYHRFTRVPMSVGGRYISMNLYCDGADRHHAHQFLTRDDHFYSVEARYNTAPHMVTGLDNFVPWSGRSVDGLAYGMQVGEPPTLAGGLFWTVNVPDDSYYTYIVQDDRTVHPRTPARMNLIHAAINDALLTGPLGADRLYMYDQARNEHSLWLWSIGHAAWIRHQATRDDVFCVEFLTSMPPNSRYLLRTLPGQVTGAISAGLIQLETSPSIWTTGNNTQPQFTTTIIEAVAPVAAVAAVPPSSVPATRTSPGVFEFPRSIGRHAMALHATIVQLRSIRETIRERGLGLMTDPPLFSSYDTISTTGGTHTDTPFIRCHVSHDHLTTTRTRPAWQGVPGISYRHRREQHHVGTFGRRYQYWFVYQDTGETLSDADAEQVREVVIQLVWDGGYRF